MSIMGQRAEFQGVVARYFVATGSCHAITTGYWQRSGTGKARRALAGAGQKDREWLHELLLRGPGSSAMKPRYGAARLWLTESGLLQPVAGDLGSLNDKPELPLEKHEKLSELPGPLHWRDN
jgi:hypothetical protein